MSVWAGYFQKNATKLLLAAFFDCQAGKSGVNNISNSCKFTYTMWKYIIISSILLLGGSYMLYSETHKALTGPENGTTSELALIQEQLDQDITTKTGRYTAKMEQAYQIVRKEAQEANVEKENAAKLKAEQVRSDAEEVRAEYEAEENDLKAETDTRRAELRNVIAKTAPLVSLDENSAEPSEIVAAAKALMDENARLEGEIESENSQIAALGAESERLNGLIDAARKLGQDRQARISPPVLKCAVSYVDASYSFLTLNAGIDNGGVVIGSRLAVMRGGKKICELNVTNVQSRESVAEVVKGSMLAGERVKLGDQVVSVRDDK